MNGTLTLTKRQIFILHLRKKEINLFLLLFVYLLLTRGMFFKLSLISSVFSIPPQ